MIRADDDHPGLRTVRALDEGTAARLLSGRMPPGIAPRGYEHVAEIVRALAAPATALELVGKDTAVAAAAAVIQRPVAISPSRRRRAMPFKAKVASLAFAGGLLGTTGLAAAGVLPAPIQDAAHQILSKVGIDVPTSREHRLDDGENGVPSPAHRELNTSGTDDGQHHADGVEVPRTTATGTGQGAGSEGIDNSGGSSDDNPGNSGGNGGGSSDDNPGNSGGNGGGSSDDNPGNSGGSSDDNPGNSGGSSDDNPGNGGGNGGGSSDDNPGNSGGSSDDNPGNSGGSSDDNPGNGGGNGGGSSDDNPGNSGGSSDDNPGNGGGSSDDNPGNSGGNSDDNPGNGGGHSEHPSE